MSLERDAAVCLVKAFGDKHDAGLDDADLNSIIPSADPFRDDAQSFLLILRDAAECLAEMGYSVEKPSSEKAQHLVDEFLLESQAYLVGLTARTLSAPVKILLGGAVLGVAALITRQLFRRGGRL